MFYNDIFIKSLKINLLQVAFYHNSNHHQLINLISPHKNEQNKLYFVKKV